MIARELAKRCAMLEEAGHAPGDAERIAFEEALAEHGALAPAVYEAFVAEHAPARRRAHGVYFTPQEVVEAQVRMVARALEQLGCADGFGDPRVLVVDPAAGCGAYPLAVLRHGGDRRRMLLFEALPGPAVLARSQGLNVRQRDALAEASLPRAPIMVCLGNPPYRRRRADANLKRLVSTLIERDNGVHAKNLHNDYVYFWAWALEHVFERRRGPGVISFVSASSYLRGPAFTHFRERLRRTLDELWIVDLEGDHLAARRTRNVFPIRTPVAIAMGLRYPLAKPGTARVHYLRLNGDRSTKLEALGRLRLDDGNWLESDTGWQVPLVATARSVYGSWPLLTDLFPWQLSGVQMKRTWPIAPTPQLLRARWTALLHSPDREVAFGATRDRNIGSRPPDLREPAVHLTPLAELPSDAVPLEPAPFAYRSFDRQWVLPDARLGDYMRPSLWQVVGPHQIYLTSLLTNVLGPGPATVATALVPDMDCFRGSFGARAVIPLWRDTNATLANVAEGVLAELNVTPDEFLAYCYALLGTRGYVQRFEEELRTPGPRIPLTREPRTFRRAAELGQELLEVHTYRRNVGGTAREIQAISESLPTTFAYEGDVLRLGDGAIAPVSPRVWDYSVSAMPVVKSWLRRRIAPRRGKSPLDQIRLEQWTPALTRELLELIWLLEYTLRLEPLLDRVLDAAIASSGELRSLGTAADQQLGDELGPHRPREDEALTLIAAERFEHAPL